MINKKSQASNRLQIYLQKKIQGLIPRYISCKQPQYRQTLYTVHTLDPGKHKNKALDGKGWRWAAKQQAQTQHSEEGKAAHNHTIQWSLSIAATKRQGQGR